MEWANIPTVWPFFLKYSRKVSRTRRADHSTLGEPTEAEEAIVLDRRCGTKSEVDFGEEGCCRRRGCRVELVGFTRVALLLPCNTARLEELRIESGRQ